MESCHKDHEHSSCRVRNGERWTETVDLGHKHSRFGDLDLRAEVSQSEVSVVDWHYGRKYTDQSD